MRTRNVHRIKSDKGIREHLHHNIAGIHRLACDKGQRCGGTQAVDAFVRFDLYRPAVSILNHTECHAKGLLQRRGKLLDFNLGDLHSSNLRLFCSDIQEGPELKTTQALDCIFAHRRPSVGAKRFSCSLWYSNHLQNATGFLLTCTKYTEKQHNIQKSNISFPQSPVFSIICCIFIYL